MSPATDDARCFSGGVYVATAPLPPLLVTAGSLPVGRHGEGVDRRAVLLRRPRPSAQPQALFDANKGVSVVHSFLVRTTGTLKRKGAVGPLSPSPLKPALRHSAIPRGRP